MQGILSIGLRAMLSEIEGFVVFDLVGRRLQKEGCSVVSRAIVLAMGEQPYLGDSRLTWRHVAVLCTGQGLRQLQLVVAAFSDRRGCSYHMQASRQDTRTEAQPPK